MAETSFQPVIAALALIVRAGKVLICQRLPHAVYGGYWEFPGGKIEPGESPEQCAIREVREEVGLVIEPFRPLPVIEYRYPHAFVRLHPFLCRYISGTEQRLQCQDVKWIIPSELSKHPFPEANEPLFETVSQYVAGEH